MSNRNASKLFCEQNAPFWKRKKSLFFIIFVLYIVLGSLTFFTLYEIYNKGKITNVFHNLYDTSRQKVTNSVKPSENYDGPTSLPPLFQPQIKRFEADSYDSVPEQKKSVTCTLNNGIKELKKEIKRVFDSLTRLNVRVGRVKRGADEQTAIGDCAKMRGKLKKIYDELSRISETLSMIDGNGICRCKCPSDKTAADIGTTAIARVTDQPSELTTFAIENVDDRQRSAKHTAQLKKIVVSDYEPRRVPENAYNEYKSVTDEDRTTFPTTRRENRFETTSAVHDDYPGREKTAVATDAYEDYMSSETSNSVTEYLIFNKRAPANRSRVTDDGVVSYDNAITTTTRETTESSTKTTKPNGITYFNYDELATELDTDVNREALESIAENENIFDSTTKIPNSRKNGKHFGAKEISTEIKTTTEIVLDSTAKNLITDKNKFDANVEETTLELKPSTENILDNNRNESNGFNRETTSVFELTTENSLGFTTKTPISSKNRTIFNTKTFDLELNTETENTLEPTTVIPISVKNEYRTNVEESSLYSESTTETNFGPTTVATFSDRNAEKTTLKPTIENISKPVGKISTSSENGAKKRTPEEDGNGRGENEQSTGETQTVKNASDGPKPLDGNGETASRSRTTSKPPAPQEWIPLCFYPVPCSPNASPVQRTAQDAAKKDAIQYSAQSLNAYKKKTPRVDATIIQNGYPVMSYCPAGAMCPMTDFAGQANTLHCMLRPAVTETPAKVDRIIVSAPVAAAKDGDERTKSSTAVQAKSARDSDEILTGNLDCPFKTFPCLDNSGCIDSENWCDGRIHCNDASDESQCNCKERIDKDKLCDGYYDCPNGEDELGCFGCNNETFSCGDWDNVSHRSNCFERKNRCDYAKNCPNGRDEDECTLLSRHIENPNQIFFISYSTGYLHHNWKGNWYPVCGENDVEAWAEKACTVESGEKSKPSQIQYINEPTNYVGPYISIDGNNQISLLDSCKYHGILVECEPEICGMRSNLKFNKNLDPDRLKRSSFVDYSNGTVSRTARSKDPRVVGGVASNPGAWPWLIALYQDGIFHCGGVILSDTWVLTAAHCVNQYQKHFYEIQAGILRRFSFSPMEQSRMITHVMVHTQYSRSTMENDLAVLKLERGLEFNRWIRPVCLPDAKLSWIPFPGTICTAVGWGATVEHGPDPDNMREVEVPILPECTHKTDIDAKEICAGYLAGGHDTCQGDSGGPLLCREPNNLNKWYVAGIVSHGEGCARPMEPGVYTRVALYMDWIAKVTEETNLPQERPLQHCPGIRCKTGKQCVPTKRQCDKYVDCMNAEDEQNCDYTGSQYHVNIYRSRNTDRSNLKYSKTKSAREHRDDYTSEINVTTIAQTIAKAAAPKERPETVNATLPVSGTGDHTVSVEIPTANNYNIGQLQIRNVAGLNETMANAIRLLFDNQFTEKTFSCRRITQVVLQDHRCDGTVDCEDGTDEEACDCKTRLAHMFDSSAVCDGFADCKDSADETACAPKCKSDEKLCRPSAKTCVKRTAWCDGTVDCSDGDDEKYCTTLTNGTTAVVLDQTGRPALRQSGVVAVNRNGVWRVRCVDESTAHKIAHDTCVDQQFMGSESHKKVISWNSPLPLNMKKVKITDVCEGLYVICSARKTVDVTRPNHWHADIVVDGTLVQSGVLIKSTWVLVQRTGLNLERSHATAVLGGGPYTSVWIESPYEQVARVDAVRPIAGTEFDLLRLARPMDVSRAVTPLEIPVFHPTAGADHACYAVGRSDADDKTETAVLRPDAAGCDGANVCFAVSREPRSCSDGKNMAHVTAVVCESNFSLFLAAAVPANQPGVNFCDRNARLTLPAAEDLMAEISIITAEIAEPTPIPGPVCNGIRCQLGECVPWEKVCDGIPQCRDERDETIKMCRARTNKCKTDDTLCVCEVGSFRCANGKCVPKTAFCDGLDDCGDATDEPKTCQENTCADYLRLTAPERLCDGRWDCLDKTDEEFTNCPGYCNRTDVYHCQSTDKCISTELVCDGEKDCAESDDESECMGLIAPDGKKYRKNEGVLATRSYGRWHAQCITEDYTNVDYHLLCKGLGFKRAVGIKKTASSKVDFENFTVVQLNSGTDVTIRSSTKEIVRHRADQACATVHVVCSSP